ncbi:MAG: hypothetical protein DI498_01420 [Paracoccus denitrificans]|nr:MAG: hypothetical protein DI498_01420 [Paracoccus denitrificans]PZO85828.1 MAG: hypothetical protein DI633_01420 [Paracoccus denitrificans]
MRLYLPLLFVALAVAGCSNPEKTGRYLIDPPDMGRVNNALGTAELKDVSLPEYAAAGEVSWQTADGAVRSNPRSLWADKPERAFTLTLARTISDISGATVIAEPWPLAEPPKRRVEVRVERALAQSNGIYRLTGRYYVSNDSSGGANYARSFDIQVPLAAEGPGPIARAQSQALGQLARQIATLGGTGSTVRTTAPKMDPLFGPLSLAPVEGS